MIKKSLTTAATISKKKTKKKTSVTYHKLL